MATNKKSHFHEFLKMELAAGVPSADVDIEMERRLAKKLKVKKGSLGGFDDGINELLDGVPSAFDYEFHNDSVDPKRNRKRPKTKTENKINERLEDDKEDNDISNELILEQAEDSDRKRKRKRSKKKRKKTKTVEEVNEETKEREDILDEEEKLMEDNGDGEKKDGSLDGTVKYVAPHLRAFRRSESEEISRVRRSVRGLLNRISESNVETITQEVASIFQSVTRNVGCQIIGEEVLASCVGGPRSNEQYAAVFAAFVAGMACLVGVDFSARLIASLAKSFEEEYAKDDSLSLQNLTLLLSCMCIFGVCSSDLIYDLLSVLSTRLTELDVSIVLIILHCSGTKLRSDDPTAMKDFVISIQKRVNELKLTSENTEDKKPKINSKRMDFMLETICDIKNNKKRSKEDPPHHTRIKKWLQKIRADDILLRGLRWSKLLDPNKKGQWWLSGDTTSTTDNVKEVAKAISKEVLETQKLVHLAAAQRMNTELRRAIFCIIMSAEDYVDAFEKILRLDLSGEQDREIMRVLVSCCLQEKVFNKYYTVLASKFCSHDKNHKFTLQYCLWDHFKELESMELNRSVNLAKFVVEMLSNFNLSLSVLKTVDFMDPNQLTPKRIMHFRILFEVLFENSDALIWNIFTRIAGIADLEPLRDGLVFFTKQYVFAANCGKSISGKFKLMKKALQNEARVLM